MDLTSAITTITSRSTKRDELSFHMPFTLCFQHVYIKRTENFKVAQGLYGHIVYTVHTVQGGLKVALPLPSEAFILRLLEYTGIRPSIRLSV